MYTYDQAFEASTQYFGGDTYAANVWVTKYALKSEDGSYLEQSPDDMHRRLAREFARIEAKYPNPIAYDEIYSLLKGFKYIVPQGSPMSGIGNDVKLQSLSNCYVIDSPADSYGGILLTDQEQAQLMKRRGGVGFDISTIRPKGCATSNAAVTTDGIGVFMEGFSDRCRQVAQGGRRGALMLTCDVHHPEIETFITIKNQLDAQGNRVKVTGANVSVKVSDEFMQAVEEGTTYVQRWPIDASEPVIQCEVDARRVWDLIASSAQASAEPGVLFWDTARRETPSDAYPDFRSVSTNPCGEIILSAYDSCRLMVVNLTSFVEHPFTWGANFNFEDLYAMSYTAQRLMDDLVDLELEQVDKILAKIERDPEAEHVKRVERELWQKVRTAAERGRRTGLGITGLGDVLAMLQVKYGSDESLAVIEEIYSTLTRASYASSIDLARERGAFPAFSAVTESGQPFIQRVLHRLAPYYREAYKQFGRRNIANITTAPTGSVSILTQTTSGIEPAFALTYMRRKKLNPNDPDSKVDYVDPLGDAWQHYQILHHGFATWCEVTGRDVNDVLQRMAKGDYSDVEASPYHGSLANDIDWTQRVEVQGRAQRWVCHAISSTINLPEGTTVETVKTLYSKAWKAGCKGVTVYVEGSRDGVLVRQKAQESFEPRQAPKRPDELECDIHHARVKRNDEVLEWTFLVGLLDGRPYEIFGGCSDLLEISKNTTTGRLVKRTFKTGGKYDLLYGDPAAPNKIKDVVKVFDSPDYGVFTRVISTALRHGTPSQYLVEQLGRDKDSSMFTFAKAMARVLKTYIEDGTKASTKVCEACGAENSLIYQEGCMTCLECGHSKCG